MSHEERVEEQLWALVLCILYLSPQGMESTSALFVAQTLEIYLTSESGSKLTISWLSGIGKLIGSSPARWLTIRASDSHFGVTLRAL